MGEEQAVAAIMTRLEQAEQALRDTLSVLHDLAQRLGKLERAIGLMICAQRQGEVPAKADESVGVQKNIDKIIDLLHETRAGRHGGSR